MPPNERHAMLELVAESKRELRRAGCRQWTERHVVQAGYASHSVQARYQGLQVPVIVVRHPGGCGCPEVAGARPTPEPAPSGEPWRQPFNPVNLSA